MTSQTPPTDRPLAAGDVPLLREGDALAYGACDPIIVGSPGVTIESIEIAIYRGETFTFVSRPATSAASEGEVDSSHGSVYDRLLTFIHDRDHALRGEERTDPSEIDEAALEIMKITNALASPPVSERERELEGALRVISIAVSPGEVDWNGIDVGSVALEALNAQSAKEGGAPE